MFDPITQDVLMRWTKLDFELLSSYLGMDVKTRLENNPTETIAMAFTQSIIAFAAQRVVEPAPTIANPEKAADCHDLVPEDAKLAPTEEAP